MDNQIFRPQAVEQQFSKIDGDVVIAQPLASRVLLLSIIACVLLTILFLMHASFDRKETVTGYLQPTGGLSKVNSPRTGIISELFVVNGELVKKGQPLALINIPEFLSKGESRSTLLLETIEQQVKFISFRKKQTKDNYKSQTEDLTKQIQFAEKNVSNSKKQIKLLEERLSIQGKRFENLLQLSVNGVISTNELQQNKEQLLSANQQLSEFNSRYQTESSRLSQLKSKLSMLPGQLLQQLAVLDTESVKLSQQKTEIEANGKVLVRAPISGRITNLLLRSGMTVRQYGPLGTIVPEDSRLKAILYVPTRAYGFVEKGQATRIRFDAFPYQRFGLFRGEVSNAASAIISPGEIDLPIPPSEPIYIVEVALNSQTVTAYGNEMVLQPGMTLSADIVLEERSLISWLFEPILSLRGKL